MMTSAMRNTSDEIQTIHDKIRQDPVIEAYSDMFIRKKFEGYELYLLTFTFNQLAGSRTASIQREMLYEIERIYATILKFTVRNPRAKRLDGLPLWIGCPGWPTATSGVQNIREIVPNDGTHLHIIACHSTFKNGETLNQHLSDRQNNYSGFDKRVFQLDCEPIRDNPAYVADYAMKSYKRHRISDEDIIILPRHKDELIHRNDRVRRPVRFGETIITPTFENDRLVAAVVRERKRGR